MGCVFLFFIVRWCNTLGKGAATPFPGNTPLIKILKKVWTSFLFLCVADYRQKKKIPFNKNYTYHYDE